MASEMMVSQHGCKGLLRFIVPDETVTAGMEIMTLKGIHIFKQDKNSSEKTFIPWSEDNRSPSSFLKRVRETQKNTPKEFLELVLDQELRPNFRPKHPYTCPKVARMTDNQFVQNAKLKLAKQVDKDNTLVTEKTTWIQTQNPSPYRPSKQSRQISHHSDWSDSVDGKDDQARAKPINVPHPQPNTL